MATIEERLTALERENTALKKSDELQTIALRALATKDEVTKLRDTNNATFDALISHDRLTNERLGDIQTQMTELDGKITGLQVETRHSFKDAQSQMVELDGKTVGMQTEMRQRFETLGQSVNSRFETLEQSVNSRFETLEQSVNSRFEMQDKKLDQILARLPEKP